MDENEKTIIVDGIELPVDTYFDAEEEEDVRRIWYDWCYYYKYVLSMCIIDFDDKTVNESDYVEDNDTDYDTDDDDDDNGEYVDDDDEGGGEHIHISEVVNYISHLRERVRAYRRNALSMKAIDEYNKLLDELNSQLGEEDEEEEFVIDREHLEKVLEDRRIRGRQQQLKELNEERQRYEEAIREEEIIIAKLREKNAALSVIADEQAIIDNNIKAIRELDKQIDALNGQ
jgi:hypothetical protein